MKFLAKQTSSFNSPDSVHDLELIHLCTSMYDYITSITMLNVCVMLDFVSCCHVINQFSIPKRQLSDITI